MLKRRYYDATESGSLGGIKALAAGIGMTRKKKLVKLTSGEDAYTLYKPIRSKCQQLAFPEATLGDQIQAHLEDFSVHS